MAQRRFAIGDIHGAHKALLQVLRKAKFNKKQDILICLGDVADGWPEVPECFETLLKIKNLIYITGNHDEWLRSWFKFGQTPYIWRSQGGQATLDAYHRIYAKKGTYITKRHQRILDSAVFYHITEDNKLFVHGGFDWTQPIENQSGYSLTWDRELFETALYWRNLNKTEDIAKDYDEVFIGNTSTSRVDPTLDPVHVSNVWNLDQGAGWEGVLTLLNIDSKEYFQSDIVSKLYPDEKGR